MVLIATVPGIEVQIAKGTNNNIRLEQNKQPTSNITEFYSAEIFLMNPKFALLNKLQQ